MALEEQATAAAAVHSTRHSKQKKSDYLPAHLPTWYDSSLLLYVFHGLRSL